MTILEEQDVASNIENTKIIQIFVLYRLYMHTSSFETNGGVRVALHNYLSPM